MKKYLYFYLLLFISFNSYGQFKFQSVYSELNGDQLLQKLIEDYKPDNVLDYSNARDTMYKVIYNVNDTVYGVYTHYGIFLPDNVDPSTYLYNDGKPSGINAEHTYPRSKGAGDGNAKSDLHHLFPSKINVNSDRGSLPFNEINDNQTTDWYYKNIVLHSKPSNNIDKYSEHIKTYFEPREEHKGNVARAMFYFYTMYKSQADSEDSDYFDNQKNTLCEWHFQDPVDSLEWVRTWMIASYQDNKPNPFVLDCSLAGRTYCDFISNGCKLVETKDVDGNSSLNIILYPNPVKENINIQFINPGMESIKISIFDMIGLQKFSQKYTLNGNEIERLKIPARYLNRGVYLLSIESVYAEKIINIKKIFVVE